VSAAVTRRAATVSEIANGPVMYTVLDAATALGISAYATRELIRSGHLEVRHLGRVQRVTRFALLSFLGELS
jgi:hypothetical protein